MSKHDLNAAAFLECVGALLDTGEVSSMKRWRHHFSITCYQHSLFVSYVAFRLARYFGWDYRAAARAGLLHDLYLYDPADGSAHPGNQCLDHPEFAMRNAAALCPVLPDRANIAIVSHMFPLACPFYTSDAADDLARGRLLCVAVGPCLHTLRTF